MTRWTGWIAALGGLVSIVSQWVGVVAEPWLLWVGGLAAIIFGVWAIYE